MGFVTQTSHPIANLLCQGHNNKDQDEVNDTDDNILDFLIQTNPMINQFHADHSSWNEQFGGNYQDWNVPFSDPHIYFPPPSWFWTPSNPCGHCFPWQTRPPNTSWWRFPYNSRIIYNTRKQQGHSPDSHNQLAMALWIEQIISNRDNTTLCEQVEEAWLNNYAEALKGFKSQLTKVYEMFTTANNLMFESLVNAMDWSVWDTDDMNL